MPIRVSGSTFLVNPNFKRIISRETLIFDLYCSYSVYLNGLKSAALAKYHRRKKSFIKRKIKKTKQMQHYVGKDQKLWTKEIFRKYSMSGASNFLAYANRAMKLMNEPGILRQVRKHKIQLKKFIDKKNK